jgi:hypothetical protein
MVVVDKLFENTFEEFMKDALGVNYTAVGIIAIHLPRICIKFREAAPEYTLLVAFHELTHFIHGQVRLYTKKRTAEGHPIVKAESLVKGHAELLPVISQWAIFNLLLRESPHADRIRDELSFLKELAELQVHVLVDSGDYLKGTYKEFNVPTHDFANRMREYMKNDTVVYVPEVGGIIANMFRLKYEYRKDYPSAFIKHVMESLFQAVVAHCYEDVPAPLLMNTGLLCSDEFIESFRRTYEVANLSTNFIRFVCSACSLKKVPPHERQMAETVVELRKEFPQIW